MLSSPFAKNIPLNPSGKSKVQSRHPVPHRGALAIVTNVGAGCGGRGSVGCAMCSQGELRLVSDQMVRRRTAPKRPREKLRPAAHEPGRAPRKGSCGRQNRVVLAPVAGVKLVEIVGPDRASIDR